MEIKLAYIRNSKNKKFWELLAGYNVKLSNGITLEIPNGFVWDLSSVPKFLWGLFPPFGDFLLGALVHDYLYYCYANKIDLGFKYDRLFCDLEMLNFSNKYNSNKKLDNEIRFLAVRIFGGFAWGKKKSYE